MKDIAPSDKLRKWVARDPEKWSKFQDKYFQELKNKKDLLNEIIEKAKESNVTLLYGAKNDKFNNAVALRGWLF